jgi:hypothetical protein
VSGRSAAPGPAAPPQAARRDAPEGDSLLSFFDEIGGMAAGDSATDPDPSDASRSQRDDTPVRPAPPAPVVDQVVHRRDDGPLPRYRPDEFPGDAAARDREV